MAKTSKEVNLSQLSAELGGKGLIANFNDLQNKIILPADGVVLSDKDLETAIANHIAVPNAEPTVEEKLASVGLSVEDLKAALGL